MGLTMYRTQSNTVNATLWRTKRTGTGGNHKRRGRKKGCSRANFGRPISAVTWIQYACWSVETTGGSRRDLLLLN